jgi:hypothetical protein
VTTNWDLWHDDHVSPETLRALRDQLPMAIRADEGVQTLENILSLPATPQVVISTEDLAARRDYAVHSRYRPERRTNLDKHARPKLASEFKAPEGELETKIAAVFSELLGIDQIPYGPAIPCRQRLGPRPRGRVEPPGLLAKIGDAQRVRPTASCLAVSSRQGAEPAWCLAGE